jgi:hypothetical protein
MHTDALLTGLGCASTHARSERVAQLVEHLTFNQVVLGSSPSALTILKIKEISAFGVT